MTDQSQIAINLALAIVNQSNILMDAIEELEDINGWRTGADINFEHFNFC